MGCASELLIEARRRARLTQAGLARKAGIPRSVLNAYEHDRRQPGADALASLLSFAGFRIQLTPRIDLDRNARALAQVLDLAQSLPFRSTKKLLYPRFARRAR